MPFSTIGAMILGNIVACFFPNMPGCPLGIMNIGVADFPPTTPNFMFRYRMLSGFTSGVIFSLWRLFVLTHSPPYRDILISCLEEYGPDYQSGRASQEISRAFEGHLPCEGHPIWKPGKLGKLSGFFMPGPRGLLVRPIGLQVRFVLGSREDSHPLMALPPALGSWPFARPRAWKHSHLS